MAYPTTPSKSQPAKPTITPYSKGSASNSSFDTQTNVSQYYEYLAHDIQDVKLIEFDEFLTLVWAVNINDYEGPATQIFGKKSFRQKLDKYGKQVSCEQDRYNPFVELANEVIKKAPDIYFVRNDPTFLWGSHAKRKPDVLAISRDTLLIRDGKVDAFAKSGPGEERAFHWSEPFEFWEFKSKDKAAYNVCQEIPVSTAQKSLAKSNAGGSRSRAPSSKPKLPPAEPVRRSSRASTAETTQTSKNISLSVPEPKKRGSTGSLDQFAKKAKREDPYLQSAGYALEMLSHGNLRSHVLGAIITDYSLELLYYDRSLYAQSTAFNFMDDPKKFIKLLLAYADLTPQQRGLATDITPNFVSPKLKGLRPPRQPLTTLFNGEILKHKDNGRTLTLKDTIFRQHALKGRGTCVFRAIPSNPEEWDNNSVVVVKLGWLSESREPEDKFISGAKTMASKEHEWVKNHLPEVLYSYIYPERDGPHQRLIDHRTEHKPELDLRELRLIVQTELFPITQLIEADEVKKVFVDILRCHHWLYNVAKILHRDISLGNLMFRRINGIPHGVLNDFDLASRVDFQSDSPTSNQRTGTKPFMAIDLLRESAPPRHLYRHDLESLFYVLVFMTSRYSSGTVTNNPPLQLWLTESAVTLAKEKADFMSTGLIKPTRDFDALKIPLVKMKHALYDGLTAQGAHRNRIEFFTAAGGAAPPPFDDRTLDGHVTFDKFIAAFDY